MIRKLIVPLVAAGLLAGCVSDYTLRGGGGGGSYYYGRPSVDYNYYGGYGGYGPYGGYPYGEAYRYRGYGYGYGGYPYYGYPYGYGYPRYYYPNRPHRPPSQPNNPSVPRPPRADGGVGWRDARPVGGGAWAPRDPGMSQPRSMPQPRMSAPAAPSGRADGGRSWKEWRNAER
jgi:hypothetical protein